MIRLRACRCKLAPPSIASRYYKVLLHRVNVLKAPSPKYEGSVFILPLNNTDVLPLNRRIDEQRRGAEIKISLPMFWTSITMLVGVIFRHSVLSTF